MDAVPDQDHLQGTRRMGSPRNSFLPKRRRSPRHRGKAPGSQGEVLTGEVKYFLCPVSPEIPLKILLFVAFSRWRIERLFQDGKGEVGFDHFEVRHYRSLMRHLVLTTLSLYFLCEQTDRLRKKKSELVHCPGEGCDRGTTRSGDATARAYSPSRKSSGEHPALARKERANCLLP